MTEDFFPTTEEMPEIWEEESEYDTTYKKSLKWDEEKGDFVRNAAGKIEACEGKESYRTWCYKAASTERYQCLAYSDDLGTEIEEALEEEETEEIELALERYLTEAIMINPRTESVSDFIFTWEADELHCSFVVKAVEEEDEFMITI